MKAFSRFPGVLIGLVAAYFGGLVAAQAGPIVTGTDFPSDPLVRLFTIPGGAPEESFEAYSTDFVGGVRVALGDITGDGVPDIITAPGGGLEPRIKVFDGVTRALIRNFLAYEAEFTAGVFVAAGDVNGDGVAEIITGTDASSTGGPRVRVFRGSDSVQVAAFFPYNPAFTGGVRVAAGDVNGDGIDDIITGAGSTAPHVKAFHGRTLTEYLSFFAYAPSFSGGVYVAVGDVNGDGYADIVTGTGGGVSSHVKVFSGVQAQELRSFFPYEQSYGGGVRVAAGDVNGDGRADVITVPGSFRAPLARVYSGRNGALLNSFNVYSPTYNGGVFAGGVPTPPVRAVTNPATDVTVNSAKLNGTVDANGRTVSVRFQYGLTTSYGMTVTADPPTVSGTSPTPVSAILTGLQPAKTYHFRVVASDGIGGTVLGFDRTFTTTTNLAPTGGGFAVAPPSPVTAGTVLTATFSGWTDPEAHTPLRYEVREGNVVIVPATEDTTSQFTLPPGTHVLTGRVYDDLGAVTETPTVEVVVTGVSEHEVLFVSRDPVPGAGAGGIPADSRWATFGSPAVANASVKFFATFSSPSGRGGGIFSNGTPVTLIGSAVPGAGAVFAIPAGAVFKSFRDPVTDAAGHVAFIGTISAAGVTAANDTVVVSDARTGSLEVIAREGFAAPGAAGTTFSTFLSVSVGGSGVGGTIFTARLRGAPASTNHGAWWLPTGSSSAMLMIRKGQPGFVAGETIRSFILHQAWPGTPGQGRGQVDGDEALLQATLNNGRQAQVLATPAGLSPITETGDPIGVDSVWVGMAQPSHGNGIQFLSNRGTFRPASAPSSSPLGTGVLTSADGGVTWGILAALGGNADGTDGVWAALGFPVNSNTNAGVAFLGRARGGTVTTAQDSGVWWMPPGGFLGLLAQEGTQAVGCAAGVKFRTFSSLAYQGGTTGPIFVATVIGPGVTAGNDTGVWTVDNSGSLRLLFREGQQVGMKRVASFTILAPVIGSPGVKRAFNDVEKVTWRAAFTDGTAGVVVTEIP
jgi:hypothetical protein